MSVRHVLALLAIAACGSPRAETSALPPPGPTPALAARPVAVAPQPVPQAAIERLAAPAGASVVLARVDQMTVAYIADQDARALRVVDVDGFHELATIALGGTPGQLVMLADHRLAVALRDRDQLAVLAGTGLPAAPLAITQRLAIPGEPIGLALAPDDRTLVVTSGWGHALTAVAVGDELSVAARWNLAPEPRAVVVTDDGRFAYVSHAIGQNLERIDLAGTASAPIAMTGSEEIAERHSMITERPRVACQGFALARSIAPGGRIYAPQVQVFSGDRTVPSAGYGGSEGMVPEVFAVAVVDEDRGTALTESLTLRLLDGGLPCVLPRAAVASSTGSLFVTCLGSDSVVELDGASISPATAELRRWTVAAGPAGIALDEANARAIVWSQPAHTLTRLAIAARAPSEIETLALEDHGAVAPEIARGRELFTSVADPRISGDGRACESCHPDGRQDALVWSTPLGPRQTPMLAGRLVATAPYGWNGDATDLAHHLERTFKRLHGTGLTGADREALIAYVSSLPGPVAPDATPAQDALVAEGEQIFRSADAQCSSCHGDDGREPDGTRHDVHSRTTGDQRGSFDTPSLAFVGGTAPYYHDGRYATLRDLLVGSRGRMGQTHALSSHELDALVAYLEHR